MFKVEFPNGSFNVHGDGLKSGRGGQEGGGVVQGGPGKFFFGPI